MNIKRTSVSILVAMILMAIVSAMKIQVVRAQCNSSDPACQSPGEQDKKKRPTATPVPSATPTTNPNQAVLPGVPAGGESSGSGSVSVQPGPPTLPAAKPGDSMDGWLLPAIFIGALAVGGTVWWRWRSTGPRTPFIPPPRKDLGVQDGWRVSDQTRGSSTNNPTAQQVELSNSTDGPTSTKQDRSSYDPPPIR